MNTARTAIIEKEEMSIGNRLDSAYRKYNVSGFVEDDPVSVPHRFLQKQDIEISAFFTAILAWGQRKTIISKMDTLLGLMDNSPYEFIINHRTKELKPLTTFSHRTFNSTDLLYTIDYLQRCYRDSSGLEEKFSVYLTENDFTIEKGLIGFRNDFISTVYFPSRTGKHIASPEKGSACKRLNMFLRWMVRKDANGVDFGIWNRIKPSQLVCPLDVHVIRVAEKLELLDSAKGNWANALKLTENLRRFDATDPVKYDFALFGMGVNGEL